MTVADLLLLLEKVENKDKEVKVVYEIEKAFGCGHKVEDVEEKILSFSDKTDRFLLYMESYN
jgi:hypothetical protein